MSKFWLKYGLYGCILGLMGRKIWTRAHEESKINLRPVFQPDSSGRTLFPVDSYQNIQPIGYGYARRPIYRNNELYQAVADYRVADGSCNSVAAHGHGIVCNGKTYPNAAALFQEMEQQAVHRGGEGAKFQQISIVTERN